MDKNTHTNHVNEVLQLPTGDAFEKDLTALLESKADDDTSNLVIALIDLDHFDHVNKDFGNDVGDNVLIGLGEQVKKALPDSATLYRFGGDEFGIIFYGELEREDVFLLLEDMRKNLDITLPDGEKMTASIGMAVGFEDAGRYQELVRKADSAMYRAKYAGRDRVAMAKEEKMVPKTSHYTAEQLKRLSKLSKVEGVGEAILLREALDMLFKKYDV